MFDMQSLKLQNDLANDRKNQMIEAQRIESEKAAQKMNSILEGLSEQYNNIANSHTSKIFDHRRIIETATIHGVRNEMFNIFEASLVVDDNIKSINENTLRNVFNEKFDRVLKENDITTLREFNKHISKSHPILMSICEAVYPFVENNAHYFKHLLETEFNTSNIDKLYIEACRVLSEADSTIDDKVYALNKVDGEIKKTIRDGNSGTAKLGTAVANSLRGVLKAIKILGADIFSSINDPLTNIGFYINKVEGTLQDKDNNAELYQIRSKLKDINITLKAIMKELDPSKTEYKRCQVYIERIKILVDVIDKKLGTNSSGLQSFTIIEADTLLTESADLKQSFADFKEMLKQSKDDKNALKKLKLINMYSKATVIPAILSTISGTASGVSVVGMTASSYNPAMFKASILLFIGSLAVSFLSSLILNSRTKKMSPNEIKEAINEAKEFSKTLDKGIELAKKENNIKMEKRLRKQMARLETYIENYEALIGSSRLKRALEESIAYTDADDIQNDLAIFEANEDVFDAAIRYIKENSREEFIEYKQDLLETIHDYFMEESSAEVLRKASLFEAVLYEDIISHPIDGLSESVIQSLREGSYPLTTEFLDDDEKELVELASKLNKKDDAISIIKNKVVDVIEAEAERSRKREEEEQKILSRMSPDEVDGLNASLSESTSIRIGSSVNRVNTPETLFEAIVMNRSKNYIKESVSSGDKLDIKNNAQNIKLESIILYTIHETFNTLKFENYTPEKRSKLMNEYYHAV